MTSTTTISSQSIPAERSYYLLILTRRVTRCRLDFYADISADVENRFDTSEYPANHPAFAKGFPVGKNKKIIGMFKDEAAGRQIHEFVGWRAKLYSYKMFEGTETKKCKGIKKASKKR